MASFQSLDATVHKNITSTHSYTQFLLSQINPICTMNFFLGTLYVCNGGWILTVVRALQVFTGPVIPYLSSFWTSLWCGRPTLSNALAKSIIITPVCLPLLRLARISCVKASNCVSVDRFFSKSMLLVEEDIVGL